MQKLGTLSAWLTVGMGIKRWLVLLVVGVALVGFGITHAILNTLGFHFIIDLPLFAEIIFSGLIISVGFSLTIFSVVKLSRNILD